MIDTVTMYGTRNISVAISFPFALPVVRLELYSALT